MAGLKYANIIDYVFVQRRINLHSLKDFTLIPLSILRIFEVAPSALADSCACIYIAFLAESTPAMPVSSEELYKKKTFKVKSLRKTLNAFTIISKMNALYGNITKIMHNFFFQNKCLGWDLNRIQYNSLK